MHSSLLAKIHPVIDRVDGVVAGLLSVILRQSFTSPKFDELQVTHEGMVYLHADDDEVSPIFAGPIDAVQHALVRVAGQAGLNQDEMRDFEHLFRLSAGTSLYH